MVSNDYQGNSIDMFTSYLSNTVGLFVKTAVHRALDLVVELLEPGVACVIKLARRLEIVSDFERIVTV